MFKKEIGFRLRVLRYGSGSERIRDFAKVLKVNEDRYDKWEKGVSSIPAEEVQRLKKKFGITADWLYFGDELELHSKTVAMIRDGEAKAQEPRKGKAA